MIKKVTLITDYNNNLSFFNINNVPTSDMDVCIDTSQNPTVFVEFGKTSLNICGDIINIEDQNCVCAKCFVNVTNGKIDNIIYEKLRQETIRFLENSMENSYKLIEFLETLETKEGIMCE